MIVQYLFADFTNFRFGGFRKLFRELSERNAFIILKDHKLNFPNSPKYKRIFPTKSEIGKISKIKLDIINSSILVQF